MPSQPALPPEFDPACYAALPHGADLAGRDPATLAAHYQAYGAAEGRPCSAVTSRAAFLTLLPAAGPLLEIGPFCAPWPAEHRAEKVSYLDIMPTAALRATAATLPWADADRVPEIDYVWRGEPYRALIRERFDTILSSHCIEHQPCLVTHLTDLASVLTPAGRVFLVIPDHRYAFDHYLPTSTLADVLAAYAAATPRHAPRSVIAQHLWQTHNDPAAHWHGDHGPTPDDAADPALPGRVAAALAALRDPILAHDLHAWQFTPSSFRAMIDALAIAGLSPLRIERLYPTLRDRGEFYAVLHVAA